jgi:DNA-binding NarL/FixJ family response regulator
VTLRVLVCDDHPVYRQGLRLLLAEFDGIEVIGEAADGEQAVALTSQLHPDVVVMDLHLPGISGVEATQRLLAARPEVGVLVLTMFEDDTSLIAALRAGARGYLVKGADHQQVLRAIHAVACGEVLLGAAVSAQLTAAVSGERGPRPFPELTPREYEILGLVAEGLANHQIASRLYLSPKTVHNYVSNILQKLRVNSRSEAIVRARDAGINETR